MANETNWIELGLEDREKLIAHLVDELPVLRTKLGVSQTEIASLIDISRQTYSSIETKKERCLGGLICR